MGPVGSPLTNGSTSRVVNGSSTVTNGSNGKAHCYHFIYALHFHFKKRHASSLTFLGAAAASTSQFLLTAHQMCANMCFFLGFQNFTYLQANCGVDHIHLCVQKYAFHISLRVQICAFILRFQNFDLSGCSNIYLQANSI